MVSRLQHSNSLVYGAVCDFVTRRQQVNRLLLTKLKLLTSSPNYSGDISRGVRVGSGISVDEDRGGLEQPLADGANVAGGLNHTDDDNDEELGVDETDELVGQLVDYVSDLALLP